MEISELSGTGYITKSITGQEIIDAAGGGTGTVTSVDLTMPSAFTVTGNPITTAGTLAVAGAGVATQYIRGDGQLANFPTDIQSIPIVVNTNTTATNDSVYHVIANATFTDPTPVEGRGYVVIVRSGTATIGGSVYPTTRIIYRIYQGGGWQNYEYRDANSNANTFVPQTRTINGLDLSANRTLTTADIADSTNKRYVTDANLTVLGNTSGTNTGDQNLSGLVPYTGATANVDLGTFHLDAAKGTFTHSGSTDTLTANHTSGSGIGLLITKGGNNEGLKVNKTSGSGNAATIVGTLEATTIVKTGGTSTQFLMADGTTSLKSNPFPLFGAAMGNVVGAATPVTRFFAFLSLAANTAENQRQIPVPYAVTFKNFFCFFGVGASQPATGSLVLTIRKNGVDTAITITIPAGSSIGTYSDTTNSESFAAGDLISVKAVNNALATSGNITSITLGTI
jgi:hypothetical protein